MSRFGVPGEIISDRGSQFVSQLWTNIAQSLGTTLQQHDSLPPSIQRPGRAIPSPAQSLSHRSTEEYLLDRPAPVGVAWHTIYPQGRHQRITSQDGFWIPAQPPRTVCRPLRGPAYNRTVPSRPPPSRSDLRPTPTSTHRPEIPTVIPDELLQCPFVLIRREGYKPPLIPPYDGPFQVLERSDKFFRIKLGEREDKISIDLLKPAIIPNNATPGSPKKRGRPRKAPDTSKVPSSIPLQNRAGPQPTPSAPPPMPPHSGTTRSGRMVRIPARYIVSVGGGPVEEVHL